MLKRHTIASTLPQNGLPSSFNNSCKDGEDTLCSLCSRMINSTTDYKSTEKPCKGGATFLTPTYSLQTLTITFLAAFRLPSGCLHLVQVKEKRSVGGLLKKMLLEDLS